VWKLPQTIPKQVTIECIRAHGRTTADPLLALTCGSAHRNQSPPPAPVHAHAFDSNLLTGTYGGEAVDGIVAGGRGGGYKACAPHPNSQHHSCQAGTSFREIREHRSATGVNNSQSSKAGSNEFVCWIIYNISTYSLGITDHLFTVNLRNRLQ